MGRSILRTAVAAGVSVARSGLAGVLALSLTLPAQAETVRMNARPGQRTFLQGFTHYFPDQGCRSQAASIELVAPPRGGRIEQRREFKVLSGKLDQTGGSIDVVDGCEAVKKDSMSIYYTARPDFSGLDTLSVAVTFGDGSTVPYTFRIKVADVERRQAPAVTRAPAPRDGDPGRAAQTAREAPAERAASTGDFLRDTVRHATPTSRPAAAIAPPKAAGTTETDAPIPQPPAPRAMMPPPSPRPPAMPQL